MTRSAVLPASFGVLFLMISGTGAQVPGDRRGQSLLIRGGTLIDGTGRPPVDNAVMEAFFSTVKVELGDRFETSDEAKRALFEYLEAFYNQRRRHSTVGYVSPAVFEQRAQSTQTSARCM